MGVVLPYTMEGGPNFFQTPLRAYSLLFPFLSLFLFLFTFCVYPVAYIGYKFLTPPSTPLLSSPLVNMTDSIYSVNRESSSIAGPDYMNINSDEAEAGSILLSLSQQSKQRTEAPSSTITNSMSIRNLLGKERMEKRALISLFSLIDLFFLL